MPWLIIPDRISARRGLRNCALFDERERVGEHVEMPERRFDAADDACDPCAGRPRQDHLQNNDDEKGGHRPAAHPPDRRRENADREHNGSRSKPDAFWCRRS